MPKPAKVKVRVSTQPVVVMEAEVARKIRQHARTSMKAEVCGVLIGNTEHERMTVEACIPGINAAQGGAHVTFTQDTWEHIYKIKDKEYTDDGTLDSPEPGGRAEGSPEPAWMKWATQFLGYAAAILLGLVSGYALRNWQVAPVLESYQQIMDHPIDACRVLLQPYISIAPEQNGIIAPAQTPQQTSPQPQQKAPAPKGNNGKQ